MMMQVLTINLVWRSFLTNDVTVPTITNDARAIGAETLRRLVSISDLGTSDINGFG
jgi:hypothetical protein